MADFSKDFLQELWSIDYNEVPVSPRVFFNSTYYFGDNAGKIYPRWLEDLEEVLDPKNKIYEWCISGGIGIGKTTIACASLMYKIYQLLCLKNPHEFFNLMAVQPITFILFSIFKYKAHDIVYEKLINMLNGSPYFRQRCRERTNKVFGYSQSIGTELEIKLPNSVRIITGSTGEHALSEDILGGILDEVNFRLEDTYSSESKYLRTAMGIYNAVSRRIKSRFYSTDNCAGLLCLVSSKRATQDFLEVYIDKVRNSPNVKVSEYSLWDVKSGYSKKRFYVLLNNSIESCKIIESKEELDRYKAMGENIIEVPVDFKKEFENDLLSALRDIAGVSVEGDYVYIKDTSVFSGVFDQSRSNIVNGFKINQFTTKEVRIGLKNKKEIADYIDWTKLVDGGIPKYYSNVPRVVHIDLSKKGDATGIAMGCIAKVKESKMRVEKREIKTLQPYVWIDFVIRVKNFERDEIDFDKVVNFVKLLRDGYKFRIDFVSYDGFQSVHSLQSLSKSGFNTGIYSVDRIQKGSSAYEELLQLMNTGRISIPYDDFLMWELKKLVRIETRNGWKFDHQDNSSKDCADALAGVVGNLLNLWNSNKIVTGVIEYDELLLLQEYHKKKGADENLNDMWVIEDYKKELLH